MKKLTKEPFALLLNDIHLSKDNISEFRKNWDEAISICRKKEISLIIIGGDLWQSRTGQTLVSLMAARDAIKKADDADIGIIIESGNHDKVDLESVLSYNHIFSDYNNVSVVDDYSKINVSSEVTLWLISYFPENGSFTSRLSEIIRQLQKGHKNLLYCHEGINGVIAHNSDKELSAGIFKPFDKVLVGHYHDRAVIADGLIEYIGASRQHNFGEDENKGYTILFTDGTTEFIQNQVNTRYKTIISTIDSLKNAKKEIENTDKNTKIRIKISCSSDEAATIDKQALIEMGASRVEVESVQQISDAESENFDVKFTKEKLKEEYAHFCTAKEIDDVELGLQYLDKIEGICGDL